MNSVGGYTLETTCGTLFIGHKYALQPNNGGGGGGFRLN